MTCFFNEDEDSVRIEVCPIGQVSQMTGTKVQVANLSSGSQVTVNTLIIIEIGRMASRRIGALRLRTAEAGFVCSEFSGVNRHTHGGVHTGFFEGANLARAANAACCGNRQLCNALKLPEPG
jgi:hypothetical protein